MPKTGTRRLESISDAAAYADILVRTIRRFIADGRLNAYRIGLRLVKVDLNDLDAMMRPVGGGA
ncbi:helix-turn-helix domain-containing protein [Gordonia rhizosphera]|uniref:Putative phage excisionase n=1 Tax=Gordonia rhizosphera NBRC 16068 TaxID=1108045 RepID=K6X4J9_9ACTN|nr:helix-turn-helix domain-containing protein [Gordonia rhizosphera]GAB93724.1 putative phage excisionase [Gordonia rhizosphera NBRC 16068]